MLLDWLNITVTTMFDLLWYLVVSPPLLTPPNQAADGPAKATLPSPQPYDDSSLPPLTPQTAADSPLAEKETLPSPQPYDDSSPPPPTSQAATDSPAKETLPSPQPNDESSPPPPTPQNQAGDGPAKATPPPSLQSPPQCVPIEQSLFALVIGIDEYADPNVHNLTGAVADADAVNDFLQKTLHVPEYQIKNLRNKEVTRVTIEREIKNLGDNPAIKRDDPILIFYAGHGADVKAPPGWPTGNADEKIQMLVPHDFIKRGSDDFKRDKKESDNITVILDCCHSGSGTRTDDNDQTFAVRGIELPASYTIPNDLHPHDIDPGARADSVPEVFKKAGLLSHVLLSACKAEQVAREIPTTGESKGKRGVFTSALLGVLEQHKDRIDKLTYKDVIDKLDLPDKQDPQCEGDQLRYLFNSKVTSPSREIYPIRASKPEDRDVTLEQYVLEAGEAHGITKNAEFAVFADRSLTSALGTVVVANTAAFSSSCNFTPRDDKTQRFTLGFALQTRVGEGQDVSLLIELDEKLLGVFEKIAKEMQSANEGKRGFRLVESRDDAPDLVVAAHGDRIVHFEIMDKFCRQRGLTHMPFHNVKIDDAEAIHRILRSSADFYWHLHRSSKRSPLAGKVILECMKLKETGEYTDDLEEVLMPDPNSDNLIVLTPGPTPGPNSDNPNVLTPDPNRDKLNVEGVIMIDVDEDAIYGFKITNKSSKPLYVSMFYFDISDLSINSYYQPGHAKKDADVSLPPYGSLTIGYGASGTVPRMYTLRKGQDVDVGFLKLFFSMKYMDLSGVVQRSPFEDVRQDGQREARKEDWWHTMCIAVVQTKGGGAS
ncbi:uncharacterized protein ARMOST_19134 [Armillaria ostoyae]|uniref:Peptidase C14 caspase domain-containing protein n=1 Tax=Armillaria ostoyae TaxID=47428 RepID=A0A284S3N9_ARMOS|nr:uncharacterized protein ARMOST_19134 [Armillaria ostoyae]